MQRLKLDHSTLLLLLLATTLAAQHVNAFGTDAIIFHIKPTQTKCFKESILPNTQVRGEIVVMQGTENMAIDFMVASPTNAILHTRKNVNHDKWSFKTPKLRTRQDSLSEFKFCVTGHSIRGRIPSEGGEVRLSVEIGTASRMASYEEAHHMNRPSKDKVLSTLARASDLHVLQASIGRMEDVLSEIIDEVDLMRNREDLMAGASNSLTRLIVFYSIVACAALVAAAAAQTAFVSKIIDKRLYGLRRGVPL